jgi:hypothetical protein
MMGCFHDPGMGLAVLGGSQLDDIREPFVGEPVF